MTRLDTTRAVCRDLDPEAFFPLGDDWSGPAEAPRIAFAKRACAGCPIRSECLADARERGDAFAIVGGTLPDERRVRAPRPRVAAGGSPAPRHPDDRAAGGRPSVAARAPRTDPTPKQRHALIVAVAEPGCYIPGSIVGSVTQSMVRDQLAERVERTASQRRSVRLTDHGIAVAQRCAAEELAALTAELDALAGYDVRDAVTA